MKLEEIYKIMKKTAKENMQPKPNAYFVKGWKAYVEIQDQNPIVMATLEYSGWEPAW